MRSLRTHRSARSRRVWLVAAALAAALIGAPWAAQAATADHCCCAKSDASCVSVAIDLGSCCTLADAAETPLASTAAARDSLTAPTAVALGHFVVPASEAVAGSFTFKRHDPVTDTSRDPLFVRHASFLL